MELQEKILSVLGLWPMSLSQITRQLPPEYRDPEQVHKTLGELVKHFQVRKKNNRYSLYPPHHWG